MAAGLLAAGCSEGWEAVDGLAERRVEVKARGVDLVPMTLIALGDERGPVNGFRPGVVLCPGGLVEPERYLWLARDLARRGFVVAVPEFALDLGFFEADNAQVARRVLEEGDPGTGIPPLVVPGRTAVAGHSLGGVVAAGAAADGGFAAVVLLASYPADGDAVEKVLVPLLSIAGERDCDTDLEQARAGFDRFGGPRIFAQVAGLTHYGFTDSTEEDEDAGCAPNIELQTAHSTIGTLVGAFLGWSLEGSSKSAETLHRGMSGVTLVRKP